MCADRRSRVLTAAVAAVVAVVLTGCRVEVVAELDLGGDGSGSAVVDVFLDRELLTLLDELEVDAVTEVEAAAGAADDWDLDVVAEGADGLRLRLEHQGPDPARELGELAAGLAAEDPGLRADLEVRRTAADGGPEELELVGDVLLSAPQAPGVIDGSGRSPGPDAARLESLMREHVTGALVVSMPGRVRRHDADRVEDGRLRWELPVQERVGVAATSVIAPFPVPREVLIAGAVLLLLMTVSGVWVVRRRST